MSEEFTNESWSSPTDHFKIRHKFLSLWYDHDFLVADWCKTKTSILGRWFVPQWTPLYFCLTWFSARNRNLFLVENHLTYRTFAQRKNEKLKY